MVGYKMASKSANPQQLSPKQIVSLARVITMDNMECIAVTYLGIEEETIKNLKAEHRENVEAFNRSVLRYWRNKNGGANEIQVR